MISLGLLTTDDEGYVSFDLSGLVEATVVDRVLLEVVGQPESASEVVGEEPSGNGQASVLVGDGAVVLRVDPAQISTVARPTRPAVQAADARDWELSPASFVSPRDVTLGEGGCKTPVRSALPVQQVRYVQVVRRPTGPIWEYMAEEGARLDPLSSQSDGVTQPILLCDILEYEQTWEDVGESLGTILYSLPLAPCESVKIAVIEAKRDDMAARTDAIEAKENLDHSLFRDRNITETVKGVLREKQGGSSFMAGQGAAYSGSWQNVGTFGVTHAIGYATSQSWGKRNLEAESAQNLHDGTVQTTDFVRSLNSTVIVEGSQAEKHQLETRTVTNHNHCHALTVQYYEVLRRLRLETRYLGSRPGIMLHYRGLGLRSPRPTVEVRDDQMGHKYKVVLDPDREDLHLINRLRPMLEPNLLEPRLAANLDAVRRLLFFEAGDASALPAPTAPTNNYEVTSLHVELRRGRWGTDSDVVTLRLRTTNGAYEYARFKPPYTGKSDQVKLESKGLWGNKDDDDYEQSLGPWTLALDTRVYRSELAEFQIHFNPGSGGSDWSFKGLKVTSRKPTGEEVLVDAHIDRYFDGDGFESFPIPALPADPKPDPATAAQEATEAAARQRATDVALAWELITHLYDHRDTYGPRLVALKDPMWFSQALDQMLGFGVLRDNIDSIPAAISGQYVVFGYPGGDPAGQQASSVKQPHPTYISLPTRGVLAEAQLGNCNACEKRDVTRFWKWEESPCEQAPAIEGITPGFRGEPPKVEQGQLPNAVVQITQPPAAPDPVGLAAAMTLLGKGDAFRDMSGLPQLSQLLSGLASGAIDLVKAQQLAKQVTASQSAGGTGAAGDGATRPQTAEALTDKVNVAKNLLDDKVLTREQAAEVIRDYFKADSGAQAGAGATPPSGTTRPRPPVTVERIVRVISTYPGTSAPVAGLYDMWFQDIMSQKSDGGSFQIHTGVPTGRVRVSLPSGEWTVIGRIEAALPSSVLSVPVTVIPGIAPFHFNASEELAGSVVPMQAVGRVAVTTGAKVVNIELEPVVEEVTVTRGIEMSGTTSAQWSSEAKAGVEVEAGGLIAGAKASGELAFGAQFGLSGTLGQTLTLTMKFKKITNFKLVQQK